MLGKVRILLCIIAMTAGIETLKELQNTNAFNTARNLTATLVDGFKQVLKRKS